MPKELIEVFGAGKSATLDDFRQLALYREDSARRRKTRQDKGHEAAFRALIAAVRGEGSVPIPPAEIFVSTLATLNILESVQIGQTVEVDLSNLGSDEIVPETRL
jgi:polar amino acid transport system substrate-binding protein